MKAEVAVHVVGSEGVEAEGENDEKKDVLGDESETEPGQEHN